MAIAIVQIQIWIPLGTERDKTLRENMHSTLSITQQELVLTLNVPAAPNGIVES